jgi:PEP-CTERM motif
MRGFRRRPSISGLTSTPTSFDVSFDTIRSGETYVFGPPVPEPATWALMGIGFACLGFAGYRRARLMSRVAVAA